jgi:serine/threonine protein kinase
MDLKPDNILIDIDRRPANPSTVGRWILTDFGLSAFREDDQLYMSNFSSIQDYYERDISMYTAPRRAPGAYQPPEVEKEDHDFRNTGIPTIQGTAGRRGDVWSFGCILAEVITFAVGQGSAVKRFRVARKGSYRTDYFYEKSGVGTLSKSQEPAEYQVRTVVVDWLRTLGSEYHNTSRIVECCVQTILDILVTEGRVRPKSLRLRMMMEHVLHHTEHQQLPGHNCPLERNAVQNIRSVPPDETASSLSSQNIPTTSSETPQLGQSLKEGCSNKSTKAALSELRDADERMDDSKSLTNSSTDAKIEAQILHDVHETRGDISKVKKSVQSNLPTEGTGTRRGPIVIRNMTDVECNPEIRSKDSTQKSNTSAKRAQLAIIRRQPPVPVPRTITKSVISRHKETTPEVWSNPPRGVMNMRISPALTRWIEKVEEVEVSNPEWPPRGPPEVPFASVKYKTQEELLGDMGITKRLGPVRSTMLTASPIHVIDSALCPTGSHVAFILREAQGAVLSLEGNLYKDNTSMIKAAHKIQLPTVRKWWSRVLLAGEYVVVWDSSSVAVVYQVRD